jgi:hypothetical protein
LQAPAPRRWVFVRGAYYLAVQPGHAIFCAQLFKPLPPASGLPQPKASEASLAPRLAAQSNLHSASLLPAVSFLGGFQTPAGPKKTCAHPPGRHLKPITITDSLGKCQELLLPGVKRE